MFCCLSLLMLAYSTPSEEGEKLLRSLSLCVTVKTKSLFHLRFKYIEENLVMFLSTKIFLLLRLSLRSRVEDWCAGGIFLMF